MKEGREERKDKIIIIIIIIIIVIIIIFTHVTLQHNGEKTDCISHSYFCGVNEGHHVYYDPSKADYSNHQQHLG